MTTSYCEEEVEGAGEGEAEEEGDGGGVVSIGVVYGSEEPESSTMPLVSSTEMVRSTRSIRPRS